MLVIKLHSYYRRCKINYLRRCVDAPLTLIFRMWVVAWACFIGTSRRLIRWIRSVQYQCQYFTIHSSICECDCTCETRNAEPDIGTDGSSQNPRNQRIDGYGTGLASKELARRVFEQVRNRTDAFLRTKPRPLAGYLDPLLTLHTGLNLAS